jgi:hypothetical protein
MRARSTILALGFAIVSAVVIVASTSCASILGVDKSYVVNDAAPSPEASANPGIRCLNGSASTYCEDGTQECCLANDNSLSCVSNAGSGCEGGTDILCDNSADCAGEICCINFDSMGDLLGTNCATDCPKADTGGMWKELCDPAAETSCSSGKCMPLDIQPESTFGMQWFYACQ